MKGTKACHETEEKKDRPPPAKLVLTIPGFNHICASLERVFHGRNDRATNSVGVCGGGAGAAAGADVVQVSRLSILVADWYRHSARRRTEPRQPDQPVQLKLRR